MGTLCGGSGLTVERTPEANAGTIGIMLESRIGESGAQEMPDRVMRSDRLATGSGPKREDSRCERSQV